MSAMDDRELLEMYVRQGDQQAFRALVNRHVDLVYGACRRQLRDGHLAEDATQAVFVVLARKAKWARTGPSLCGWLYNTARYVAANALRAEAARRRSEMEAARRSAAMDAGEEAGGEIDPQSVDRLLARLKSREREAILLRFFQGREFPEVAAALRITEAAARKRVSRGIERLRQLLEKRGQAMSAAAVASALGAVAMSAPPALASAAAGAAIGGAAGLSVLSLAKGAMIMAAVSKGKTAAVAALLLLLLGGAAVYVAIELGRQPAKRGEALALERPVVTTRPAVGADGVQGERCANPKFANSTQACSSCHPGPEPTVLGLTADAFVVNVQPSAGSASRPTRIIARPQSVELDLTNDGTFVPAQARRRAIGADVRLTPAPSPAGGQLAQGDVVMVLRGGLAVGDALPDAQFQTLAGEKLDISKLKNKHLLVHFWSPADSAESLEMIRKAYEKWGADGIVGFIGICGDVEADEARRLAAERKMTWSQVHDPSWALRRGIGARRSSAYVFDGDGKVAAGPLKAEEVSAALSKAVGEPVKP
jgi:RNA polymerase sigma factor (sigma-70 family)